VQPALLAVDESKYGLGTLLPPGVAAALEAAETRRPRTRVRGKEARALWRAAVADAAMGPPTPFLVRPCSFLSCLRLAPPRNSVSCHLWFAVWLYFLFYSYLSVFYFLPRG